MWDGAELLLKVKEPIASEYGYFRDDLVLFTYLHLAAERGAHRRAWSSSGITAIAYETVQLPIARAPAARPDERGRRPARADRRRQRDAAPERRPRPARAGRARHPSRRTSSCSAAASPAPTRSRSPSASAPTSRCSTPTSSGCASSTPLYAGRIKTIASNSFEIEQAVLDADLVIGSVLVPGAKAPKLVSNALVARMKPGSVLVDIAVDQGGCFEDTHPTTHADPTFTVHELAVLLRREHAGRRAAHLDLRAHQRDAAVRARDREPRLAGRAARRPGLALGLNVHAGRS